MTVISWSIARFLRLSKPSNSELTNCWCLSALATWLLSCSSVSRWYQLTPPVLFRNALFEVWNAVLNFTCVLENCIAFWSFIYLAEMLHSYLTVCLSISNTYFLLWVKESFIVCRTVGLQPKTNLVSQHKYNNISRFTIFISIR